MGDSWIVGHQKGFGNGICSGRMMWSYTNQHLGAINSTMFLNGKPHCTGLPIHGTDASNPPGNEKGFVVKFTDCVDQDSLGNDVQLLPGDELAIEAWLMLTRTALVLCHCPVASMEESWIC